MAKVLIIDDDDMTRKVISFMVKKGGHEALGASSGAEGVALIKEQSPDIVLLDIEMPEMNGYETLEQIRANEDAASLKVVFLTGTVDDEVLENSRKLGVFNVLEKPVNAEKLLAVID